MDDKHLDKLLHGIKENYDRLPEYADTKKIMNGLPKGKRKKKRMILFPFVAGIAGLVLFFILALPAMESYQHADVGKHYLEEYAEKKEKEFQEELGGGSSVNFDEPEKQVKTLIEYYETNMSKDELDEAKVQIDTIYTTPSQLIKKINNSDKKDLSEEWSQLFRTLSNWKYSLDNNFSDLKIEHHLDISKHVDILENQYHYKGAIEIVEFFQMIHSQGFYITRTNYMAEAPLQITIDYSYIEQEITNFENHKGIEKLLTFMSEKIEPNYSGVLNEHGTPWYEVDDLLLELEDIYIKHEEEWGHIFATTDVLHEMSFYLRDYLSAGISDTKNWSEENIDILQNELYSFAENHKDSIYSPIISSMIKEYESNGWQVNHIFNYDHLRFLFSNGASNLEIDFLIDVENWTIYTDAWKTYDKYQEKNELSEVIADPTKFLSLYLYASSYDEELYKELYIGEAKQEYIDWSKVIEVPTLLVGTNVDDETIDYTFFNMMNEPTVTIRMIKEGGIWKVSKQEILK